MSDALKDRLKSGYNPVFIVFLLSVCIFFCTRICLLIIIFSQGNHLSVFQIIYSFGAGFLYDVCVASFIIIPFILQIVTANEINYQKPYRQIILFIFLLVLAIMSFTKLIPKEYSPPLYHAIEIYFLIRLIIFLILCFLNKKQRTQWRRYVLYSAILLTCFLLIVNAISEVFFWQEFSSRYNFIAVDYLIYTTEVLGNIYQSYHLVWLLTFTAIISIIILLFLKKRINTSVNSGGSVKYKVITALSLLALPLVAYTFLSASWMSKSGNFYANQLSGNGIYTFNKAFLSNDLDFYKYYQTLPDKNAFTILRRSLASSKTQFVLKDSFDVERNIINTEPELKSNVVLISVESLSASFMKSFGNKQNITPNLDSIAAQGMLFTNFYASGTRTVRGLEAITLSIPPTPGESIIKRSQNANLFSLGAVLKNNGYTTQFIYGGYAYFDNMKSFFSNNGYTVIDRNVLKPNEIHYANIWGVADEDLFNLSLRTMDNDYRMGKPFFTHIMTVSNHRPYTYPDGRIDIPSSAQLRTGAVKYTDYAIGKFINEASEKPWFSNTVFLIVADHCASSAGNVSLPVTGYHIPLIIYEPAYIKPQTITQLCGQIDIAPTLLGLLKINYRSKFFGNDVLAPGYKPRAFISTYEDAGFIKNNLLTIQSPVRKLDTFIPDFKTGGSKKTPSVDSISKESISYYQCASWLIKNRRYSFNK